MNLSQIVGMAKVLLPKYAGQIEQAEQLAKQFSPSKDGIAQLMAQHGKSKKDLQDAIKMLDNPFIQNTLGRVPGLGNMLRSAASELSNDANFNSGVNNNPIPDMGTTGNCNPPIQGGSESAQSLMARLKRLK